MHIQQSSNQGLSLILLGVLFFFSRSQAGLTNRVPVRDSRAGAPLYSVLITPPYIPAGMTGFRWNPLESTGMRPESAGMQINSTGMQPESTGIGINYLI